MADKSEFDKSIADKFESVKSECVVIDDDEQGSNSLKDNGGNIKTVIDEGEDELKTIITYFARFEEALTPIEPIAPPKATILRKHLDELEKLISLPLETLLESANLIQFRNILKLVKDLPLADPNLHEWCNALLEITTVMPQQRTGMQKLLTETEAKAQTMLQLQKEAADIRKTTLVDLQRKEEFSTCIKRVDAKIDSLKRQLVEAEAERGTIMQLEGDLTVSKLRMLKRARAVRDDLAPLIEQNAAINDIILESKNAIKNIDCHLKALILQFVALKTAVYDA